MRQILAEQITDVVAQLCVKACTQLPEDVKNRIYECREAETWGTACDVLDVIIENFKNRLNNLGLMTTVRASRGEDILAACGMLAGEHSKKEN